MSPCTREPLAPGLYRVHQDGTIQHVTKVVVTREPMSQTQPILNREGMTAWYRGDDPTEYGVEWPLTSKPSP